MKAISIFIFILCTLLSYGQVVKLKIFDINEKHPIIESHNPYPGLLILDKNKDSCKYLYENGEYSIFFHNQKSIENNEIIIYFPFSFIKIKIKYDDAISDTIKLNPLFLISNDMAMKDKWFKYDDFRYYKKIFKEKSIEYNKDSTYYCIGHYKGKKYGRNRPFNFEFLENGKWLCYNKNGQLVSKMNFKKGRFNGNYEININNLGLHIIGQHRDGSMIGKWKYNYDNKTYTWSFVDGYMVYDITKSYR